MRFVFTLGADSGWATESPYLTGNLTTTERIAFPGSVHHYGSKLAQRQSLRHRRRHHYTTATKQPRHPHRERHYDRIKNFTNPLHASRQLSKSSFLPLKNRLPYSALTAPGRTAMFTHAATDRCLLSGRRSPATTNLIASQRTSSALPLAVPHA